MLGKGFLALLVVMIFSTPAELSQNKEVRREKEREKAYLYMPMLDSSTVPCNNLSCVDNV